MFAAPESAAARIATRNVDTVWVETANYGAASDVVRPGPLGRFVDALHARGVRVVAWYLPGHVNPALDLRRSLAMLRFTTPSGQGFDGIGLDIEATKLRNVKLRSQRAVALARAVRAQAGSTPLAIIPFNPRGLERHKSVWPGFPWAELAETADAFAPMIYTGGAFKGFDATYGYVTRALRLLRTQTRDPDVAIHVAGGVADRLGAEELAGFSAAVADDGGHDRLQPLRLGDDSAVDVGRAPRAPQLTSDEAEEQSGPPESGPPNRHARYKPRARLRLTRGACLAASGRGGTRIGVPDARQLRQSVLSDRALRVGREPRVRNVAGNPEVSMRVPVSFPTQPSQRRYDLAARVPHRRTTCRPGRCFRCRSKMPQANPSPVRSGRSPMARSSRRRQPQSSVTNASASFFLIPPPYVMTRIPWSAITANLSHSEARVNALGI